MKIPPSNVDTYIASFPEDTQVYLKILRRLVLEHAPESEESISYGMPAYKLQGKPLVYFAGYKNHIGFYATPSGHSAFKEELSKYKQGKGSVQFPFIEELPIALIVKIVLFRVQFVTH
jgi:uncharacterized protein YdhG (YjbR/CyaY superfamily)